jgi:hypothetical protein
MPDGEQRKKRSDSVKEKGFDRGQQLSDKRASLVAKGKLTYDQAMARDKADDAKKSRTTKVGTETRGSSQNLPSKRSYKKAEFKLDKNGNKVAY